MQRLTSYLTRNLCPLRRVSTHRSTRQDAQINYLSTLSIFMKQTTYLATLPNPSCFLLIRTVGVSYHDTRTRPIQLQEPYAEEKPEPSVVLPPQSSTHRSRKPAPTHPKPTLMAHRALKAHTSTHTAHRALKAHTSTRSPTKQPSPLEAESLDAGWFFLFPVHGAAACLISVGGPAPSLIAVNPARLRACSVVNVETDERGSRRWPAVPPVDPSLRSFPGPVPPPYPPVPPGTCGG
jgi:hypothetical protein